MKITKTFDTMTDDVDIAGELLRELVFKQEENALGCYNTFDLNAGFVAVDKCDNRFLKLTHCLYGAYIENNEVEWEISVTHVFENEKFIVAWYWDGDGTLGIYVKEDGIFFVNDDCKKTYGWDCFSVVL